MLGKRPSIKQKGKRIFRVNRKERPRDMSFADDTFDTVVTSCGILVRCRIHVKRGLKENKNRDV